MKNYKRAFTLAELMIALGVIGILAAVLIPIVHNIMPDQNVLMARRAYTLARKAVAEIVNNHECYPEPELPRNWDPNNPKESDIKRNVLGDGNGYKNCIGWDDTVEYDDPGLKFATLFAKSVNGTFDQDGDDRIRFQTDDGIKWVIYPEEYGSYRDDNEPGKNFHIIQADVDGDEPRCSVTYTVYVPPPRPGMSMAPRHVCTNDLDVFQMRVSDSGRIDVGEMWARKALNFAEQSIVEPTSSTFSVEMNPSVDYHTPITD